VRLDRGVAGGQRGLGGSVLGHVRRLAGGLAVVVLPGRPPGHQRGQFRLDLGLGQRVRDALVRADRYRPDLPVVRVAGRRGQHVPGDADAHGRAGDPFRVQAVEHLAEPVALGADQRPGLQVDVEVDTLPEEDRRRLRRRQRHYIEEWVHLLAPLRPDLTDGELRLAVHAAIGAIQSTLFFRSGLDPDRLARRLEVMAHGCLGTTPVPFDSELSLTSR
jgi:hypothetical protein